MFTVYTILCALKGIKSCRTIQRGTQMHEMFIRCFQFIMRSCFHGVLFIILVTRSTLQWVSHPSMQHMNTPGPKPDYQVLLVILQSHLPQSEDQQNLLCRISIHISVCIFVIFDDVRCWLKCSNCTLLKRKCNFNLDSEKRVPIQYPYTLIRILWHFLLLHST